MRLLSLFETRLSSFATLAGKRRSVYAAFLGVLTTLALPPFNIFFTLWISLPGLYVLLQQAPTKKRAWADGFWFGVGHFITAFYWIAYSLMVDPGRYAWLIPFTVFGLNAIIALYPSLFALVFKAASNALRLSQRPASMGVLLFAGLWVGQEWLRGHLFTGFPWSLIGYTWTASDASMQIFWWLGTYPASAFTVAVALAPILLFSLRRADRFLGVVLLACALLFVVAGQVRLSGAKDEMVEGVKLRIVQANIPQTDKWNPARRWSAFRTYMALSRSEGYDGVTHIIWPETAMTYMFQPGDRWARELAKVAPENGALLTGVVRLDGSFMDGTAKLYNSLQAVNRQAQVPLSYDKIKLVPFGEFIPFRRFIPIPKITVGTIDFSRGKKQHSYTLPGLPPFRPLICYEAIFPEMSAGAYPAWLLNITNDAWFGTSPGPYQHLAMSRVRAVEQGVPLIRAANTGISAVIDPYGRILKNIPLNQRGIIDTELPKPIVRK